MSTLNCTCDQIDYLAVPPWDRCRNCAIAEAHLAATIRTSRTVGAVSNQLDKLIDALTGSVERRNPDYSTYSRPAPPSSPPNDQPPSLPRRGV